MNITNNNKKFKGMRKIMDFLAELPSLPYFLKALLIFSVLVQKLKFNCKYSINLGHTDTITLKKGA